MKRNRANHNGALSDMNFTCFQETRVSREGCINSSMYFLLHSVIQTRVSMNN